jgi:hypothetical protein
MKAHLISSASLLIAWLCFSAVEPLVWKASAQTLPSHIEIVTVQGEGVVHNAKRPTPHDLAVKVEDDDHRPVAGASVVFALPVTGSTGTFVNGVTNLTVVTDDAGMAVARGLRPNQIPGKLEIYITASYRGLRAKGLITQLIEGTPGAPAPRPEVGSHHSGGKWKWVVLGVVAAGGAVGGIYYHNQQHTSSNSAISISTGPVVFGSPR